MMPEYKVIETSDCFELVRQINEFISNKRVLEMNFHTLTINTKHFYSAVIKFVVADRQNPLKYECLFATEPNIIEKQILDMYERYKVVDVKTSMISSQVIKPEYVVLVGYKE